METQVKTKEDFKSKMEQLRIESRKKPKDPKYRVHPNLSIRGKELLTRIKSRNIKLDNSGQQYIMDEEILKLSRMNKKDVINEHREGAQKINSLKNKLQNAKTKKDGQAGSSTGSNQEGRKS